MRFFDMIKGFALNTGVEDTVGKISQDISINFGRLPGTLKHMGIGMLSIFIVIGVIILAVYALNKIMTSIEAKKQKTEE